MKDVGGATGPWYCVGGATSTVGGATGPSGGAWEEPRLLWAGPGLLLTLPPSSLLQKLGRRFKSQAAGGSVPLVWSQQLEKPQPSKKKGEKEA